MGKWFEVRVAAYKTCLVEVDPEDFNNSDSEMMASAQTVALAEAFSFVDTVEIVEAEPISDEETRLESAKRNADEVYAL